MLHKRHLVLCLTFWVHFSTLWYEVGALEGTTLPLYVRTKSAHTQAGGIFLPKTCLLFALYMPPTYIGTSLEPHWNLIGTSLEPRRIITDTSSHNHREIIRIKITNQNLFPFGIFGKPTTRARIVLKLLSPDMVQDILARAYLVGVLRQVFEQSKLDIGQPHNLRTTHHTMRRTVYDYVSKTIFHQRWVI